MEGGASSAVPGTGSPVLGLGPSVTKRKEEGAVDKLKVNSQSNGAEWEEEAHPCLFIENILDVVFKHIIKQPRRHVSKDVQSIRLVCKTWKDSINPAYLRTGPVITFERYDRGDEKEHGTALSDFMAMMECCQMIPAQKFKFRNSAFWNESLTLFEDFLRLCGSELVSLEMHVSPEAAEKLVRDLKNLPELNLPKLKTLELHASYSQVRVNKRAGIMTLVDVLFTAVASTLEEFTLSYPPSYGSAHSKQQLILMQQLGQLIAGSGPGRLKRLKLNLEITEPTFNILAEAGLKLERFEFGVAPKLGSGTLVKFLESQAPTLNALRIWNPRRKLNGRSRIRMDLPVEVPHLGKLVELELSDIILSSTTAAGQIDFTKSFPKLHRMELGGMNRESAFQALLSIAKTPTESLKVLHLPVFFKASLEPYVKTAAQSFPSITELHLELHKGTKETLGEVFNHFANLESLHISIHQRLQNPNWVESILSGISEADCSRFRKGQLDFGTVSPYAFQDQPSIHQLTRLRKLVVTVCDRFCRIGGNRCVPFSDLSAQFIFLEMEELGEIELANRDVRFSPRYLELLKDKLVLRE